MTDDQSNPETPEEEDFAALFENYMSGVKDDLRVGEEIKGEIISIGDQSVFVSTGTKADGVVDRIELLNDEGEMEHKIGDVLKLYVIAITDGEIRLSRALAGAGSENRLYDAKTHGIPVEGRVSETCKGGVRVQLLGKTAFCPVSQIDVAYVENPEDYVGNTYEFLITRIESRGTNIVVSRRDLLNRYIAEERERFIKNVTPGDVIDAKITKIMNFGAFAEVAPGVEGMIHISELGWKRVETPEDAVSVNDMVRVSVLSIEKTGDKSRPVKIALSIKAAAGDPWVDIRDRYHEGDRVRGTITRCADFGAFVELEPGIEGLVHISEISHKRVTRAEDVVTPGLEVPVTIKSIDPETRRISLSIKDAEGDPWLNLTESYKQGQIVTGTIEKKEKFGWFIELEPGVVGLLPLSKLKEGPRGKDFEKLREGDSLVLTIESIDMKSRRISLGPGEAEDAGNWKSFKQDQPRQKQADSGFGGLGGLGEKLQEALKGKKEGS